MNVKNGDTLTIGQLAEACGIRATALRYYEREHILEPVGRSPAGYRLYDARAQERLRFIRSAQAVGFTLDDVRALLRIDGTASCAEVRQLITRRLDEVQAKLADLERVRTALANALDRCHQSTDRCAVLVDLQNKVETQEKQND